VRRGDLDQVVEALKAPIEEFVGETRVRIALLINRSGQVLGQYGFTRKYEVVNVASLAASANAAASALAQLTGATRWTHLHHGGATRQLFIAPIKTPAEEIILVAIFDEDSSVGIVQLFFDRFGEKLSTLEAFRETAPTSDQSNFERDLEAGLEHVFLSDQ
jgi:hypothetical protein